MTRNDPKYISGWIGNEHPYAKPANKDAISNIFLSQTPISLKFHCFIEFEMPPYTLALPADG
jgi:hypothetical protein